MSYLIKSEQSSLFTRALTKTVNVKQISISMIATVAIMIIWALYFTNPTSQDHADAILAKLDDRKTTLARVFSPQPEFTDVVLISLMTLEGHILTIGVMGHVYVFVKFKLIKKDENKISISKPE